MNLAEAAELLKTALQRPVAYHRAFAQIAGKVSAGLMLSQAWYWTPRTKKDGGWFYKTREEWKEETGMSRTEQETARKRLIKLGLLEEKLAGMPAKMHFRVNAERLISLLVENPPTGRQEACKQVGGKPANMKAEKPPTITETTQESKQENTNNAHSRLFAIHYKRLGGKIMDSAAQGKAIKTLLANYTEAECAECYESQLTEEWRKRKVSWLTVLKDIGSWLDNKAHPIPAASAKIYPWQGKMYAEDEVVSDEGDRYTVMGKDGTPTKRWRTPEAFAIDTGRDVEKVRAGWN